MSARIWRKRRARRWAARLSPAALHASLYATVGLWRRLAVLERMRADPVAMVEALADVQLEPWQAEMVRRMAAKRKETRR